VRKSERLRQLELTVAKMEITIDLLTLAINNVMESQKMITESDLDSGKWYNIKPE